MVRETPSKGTDDGDGVGDGPSTRPIRKSAAKAHLAWEAEKTKRRPESGPKADPKAAQPAADSGPRKPKPKPTYDAATIPNTSDEEAAPPPSIAKIGPPKNAKRKKKVDEKPEAEEADEEEEVLSQRRDQHRRAAAGSPRRAGTSGTRARDDEDVELEAFKEGVSDEESDGGHGDDDEEEEEEEPEDDLAKLANNPRALQEKLDAEEARWAQDDAEDADAIAGLMSDDSPRKQSGRRRGSSTSQPTRSRAQERTSTTSPQPISKKRRAVVISESEGSNSEKASHTVKKQKKPVDTPVRGGAAKDKGKAKESRQNLEDREEQRRAAREQQKREERRKEREQQLRELERLRRRLEREDDEERGRLEPQSHSGKKRATTETGTGKGKEKEKEKERGREQNREREQAKPKSTSATDKASANSGKKRSKPDEDIAWADERSGQPSSSKHAAKRKRNEEASADGSELSEADIDSELDPAEGNVGVVIHEGGRIRLTDQHGRVQRVCTTAIKELLTNICIKNAYPDGPDKSSDFAKAALITAAKALKYNDILKKLRADDDYANKLASIPAQRVYNLRGKAKKASDPLASTVFNLEGGDVDKVRWLHDGLRFIYPHNYENNTVDGEKAYSQPIFYQILRSAFFNKPRSFGFTIMERFESSHPEKPDEKEIPSALLALAATAVFASIEDYRTARSEAGDFKSNLFIEAYRSNIDVLSEIKSDNIGAYHRLMHGLYCKLMGTSATSVRSSARSFLNTKGMAQ